MRKNNLHILFEKRPSFHRWFYLVFAVIYISIMDNDLEHPHSISSLTVPYYVLVIVPTLVLLTHFIFSRLVTWWSVFVLFITMFIARSIFDLKKVWFWSCGAKWEPSDFYYELAWTILLFVLVIGILYITRPRKSIEKVTLNNS